MSESQGQARRVSGVVVVQQSKQSVKATPLRVVSGSGQGQESQRFWVTARGD